MKSFRYLAHQHRFNIANLSAFVAAFVLFCIAAACGHEFRIDSFQASYDEGGSITKDAARAVVTYDRASGKYIKTRYNFATPPVQLSSDQNQLTPEKQAALSALLDSLAIDSYKVAYTDPPPASAGDATFVDTIFRNGAKSKEINVDTNVEHTVPTPLMNFVASIRSNTYF